MVDNQQCEGCPRDAENGRKPPADRQARANDTGRLDHANQADHLAGGVADVDARDIFGGTAKLRLGLAPDTPDATEAVEIVGVRHTEWHDAVREIAPPPICSLQRPPFQFSVAFPAPVRVS